MNLFQSPEWEQFKLATGYQKSYRIDGVLVLQKNLPFGRSMLYSPMLSEAQAESIKYKVESFLKEIKIISQKSKSIFYRLEINIDSQQWNNKTMKQLGFVKSFEEMQPEHTRIINLELSEAEILAQMKQKGRYNIKIAEKNGVKIEEVTDIDRFYALYHSMASRHGITYRSRDYFQKLLDNLLPKGYCKVFIAAANGQDLAAAIITYYSQTATYLFGGSSDINKNYMAPYLLHWHIMQQAKARGCKKYDLFGVSPRGKNDHAWSGVTAFKEKLGGEYVELLGSYDLVFKPTEYQLFKIVEKIRRKSN